jgi:3-dehydroquinate dehydratase-1
MSILFIEGPEAASKPRRSEAMLATLAQRAARNGRELRVVRCGTAAALAESLRQGATGSAEVLLLDPNTCVPPGPEVVAALRGLSVPFIEVHDDSPSAPEPALHGHVGSRLALVQGYGAQSDTLALAIALERIGAEEAGDVAVGT